MDTPTKPAEERCAFLRSGGILCLWTRADHEDKRNHTDHDYTTRCIIPQDRPTASEPMKILECECGFSGSATRIIKPQFGRHDGGWICPSCHVEHLCRLKAPMISIKLTYHSRQSEFLCVDPANLSWPAPRRRKPVTD
jgi:hypothetical protein